MVNRLGDEERTHPKVKREPLDRNACMIEEHLPRMPALGRENGPLIGAELELADDRKVRETRSPQPIYLFLPIRARAVMRVIPVSSSPWQSMVNHSWL